MKNTRIFFATLGTAGVLALGACGGHMATTDTEPAPAPKPVTNGQTHSQTPTTTSSPEPEGPETNKRGNIVADVGDAITLNSNGETYATVTVTSLKFESCTNYMGESFSPLVMRYTLTTSKDASNTDLISVMNPFDMTLYDGETGVTESTAGMSNCLKLANNLHQPSNLSPGSTYEAGLVFMQAPDSGAVIYAPITMSNGVEWHY